VNFYEVLADGYHSPLTKTQIAELFQAGSLRRNHPCKPVSQKDWRTIDELFPLLKYQSTGPSLDYSSETEARSAKTSILIFAVLVAAIVAGVFWYFFASDAAEHTDGSRVTVHNWPRTIADTASSASTTPSRQQTANIATTAPVTVYPAPTTTEGANETTYIAPSTIDAQQAQVAEQRRQAEQQQREQIERNRLQAERARVAQKAAGEDVIIPLDEDRIISFAGMSVRVKIHDNDVTSFDVWVNGAWSREVPKQKGITGSRTDETLIYSGGNARLYYVWELSGKLNHCRLRVRED
jgi:hypothetical protein